MQSGTSFPLLCNLALCYLEGIYLYLSGDQGPAAVQEGRPEDRGR